MRIVHFSGKALSYGVEEKKLEGVTVLSSVPQRPSLIVSSTATRLGWKSRWKHYAIAIGSGGDHGCSLHGGESLPGGSRDATVSGVALEKVNCGEP
jgi:hypothetical protein